jgi:hypothetical protein
MEPTCGGWHMKLKNPTVVLDSSPTLGAGTECPTSRDIEASTPLVDGILTPIGRVADVEFK